MVLWTTWCQCYWEHVNLWWLLRHIFWNKKRIEDEVQLFLWVGEHHCGPVLNMLIGLFLSQTVDSAVNTLTPFPSKWANAFAGSFSGIIPNKLPSCSDYWGKTSPVCNLSKFPRVLFSFGKDSHMLRKTTWKVLHWRLGWSPASFHTWFSYVVSTSWFLHLLIPNHSASLLPQALLPSLWNQQSRYIC